VQTFADAFLAIAVCLAIATLMVPLLRKIATRPRPRRTHIEEEQKFAALS